MSDASTQIKDWVDSLNLSKKVRSLPRDFSDGVLMAEVIYHFNPKAVDLHNYEQALKVDTKLYNWNTLSQKALKKLGINLDKATLSGLANAKPGVIEKVLTDLKSAISGERKAESEDQSSRKPKRTPKPTPMTDDDRELYTEKIYESERQKEQIKAMEVKLSKMMELLSVKDVRIMKLLSRPQQG